MCTIISLKHLTNIIIVRIFVLSIRRNAINSNKMTNITVISAEWNPDNQVILHIADNSKNLPGFCDAGTKRRIILDSIPESNATAQTVCAELRKMELNPVHEKFNVN
jgi:hypothetical protein